MNGRTVFRIISVLIFAGLLAAFLIFGGRRLFSFMMLSLLLFAYDFVRGCFDRD